MKTHHVDTEKFIKHEQKLIDYLRNRPSCAPEIIKAATESYYLFSEKGYSFNATWPVMNHDRIIEITVAGSIQVKTDNCFKFYSFCLCVTEDNRILRKYHYDYECGNGNNKPRYHLQYGGRPLPSQSAVEGFDEICPNLSEPRLFYTPMSLALVLEQAFLEFPDDNTEKIRQDSNWKGLIYSAQKVILAPFLERCLAKIAGNEQLYASSYV